MVRLISTILKLLIASLIVGILLARLNLSAEHVLLELGLTPGRVIAWLEAGARWIVPNLVLGALVVVPVWAVVYLFRPPRS